MKTNSKKLFLIVCFCLLTIALSLSFCLLISVNATESFKEKEIISYSDAVTRSVVYVAERTLESGDTTEYESRILREIIAKADGDVVLGDFDDFTPDYTYDGNITLSVERIASDFSDGLRVTPKDTEAHQIKLSFEGTSVSKLILEFF